MSRQPITPEQAAADAAQLSTAVRNAVEQGQNVQGAVRELTLRTISAGSVNLESLRLIAAAVMRGARDGIQHELQQSGARQEAARASLQQASAGLDQALAHSAEALKLALQEAAGRAQSFSQADLTHTRADLEALQDLLLETLQSSAASAQGFAAQVLHELAEHTRIHGSALGRQLQDTLRTLTQQLGEVGRAQVNTGLHLAQASADLLRQLTAGLLSGVADHIRPPQRPTPKDD